ncbi:MAG: Maf family protein [Thermovirga sp.]
MSPRNNFPFEVVLASSSPRRASLLRELGWDFRIVPPVVEESLLDGLSPPEQAVRIASEKADNVFENFPEALVIAADTIVVHGNEILGKPKDPHDAVRMLSLLAGKTHSVITGVAVRLKGRSSSGFEETRVTFRDLSVSEIWAYFSGGESMDKAGAYAIQGWGSLLASSIEGCYFNVVGLPLYRLSRLLEEMGVALERQWGVRT